MNIKGIDIKGFLALQDDAIITMSAREFKKLLGQSIEEKSKDVQLISVSEMSRMWKVGEGTIRAWARGGHWKYGDLGFVRSTPRGRIKMTLNNAKEWENKFLKL